MWHYCLSHKNVSELYLQSVSQKQIRLTGKWYRDRTLGINTICNTVKHLTGDCGIEGFFTNLSMRHTCATILGNNDVPDQVVHEHSGHRSDSIKSYRHNGKAMKRKVSSLLNDYPQSNVPQVLKNTDLKAIHNSNSSECNGDNDNVKKVKVDIMLNIKQ